MKLNDNILKEYDLFISGDWEYRAPSSNDERIIVNELGYRAANAHRKYAMSSDEELLEMLPPGYQRTNLNQYRQYKYSRRYDKNVTDEQFYKEAEEWYKNKQTREAVTAYCSLLLNRYPSIDDMSKLLWYLHQFEEWKNGKYDKEPEETIRENNLR